MEIEMRSDHMIVVDFEALRWVKKTHCLYGLAKQFGGSFPSKFGVKSSKTGRVVTFEQMVYGDELLDPDFWDGERAGYRPVKEDRGCGVVAAFLEFGE
jgi:hypothetical protein